MNGRELSRTSPAFGCLKVGIDGGVIGADPLAMEILGAETQGLVGRKVRELGLEEAFLVALEGKGDGGCDVVRVGAPGAGPWVCVVGVREEAPEPEVQLWLRAASPAGKRVTEAIHRLQEAQHRVKNDLNFIAASLIDAERGLVGRWEAADQVRSIAALYDLLSRRDDERIDAEKYLAAVTEIHNRRFRAEGNRLRIVSRLETVYLTHRTATLVGIVLNELLTNSTKYAYGKSPGEIRVETRTRQDRLVLSVSDDGTGIPEAQGPGAGLSLIRDILGSVGGSLELRSSGGLTCIAEFPTNQPM